MRVYSVHTLYDNIMLTCFFFLFTITNKRHVIASKIPKHVKDHMTPTSTGCNVVTLTTGIPSGGTPSYTGEKHRVGCHYTNHIYVQRVDGLLGKSVESLSFPK